MYQSDGVAWLRLGRVFPVFISSSSPPAMEKASEKGIWRSSDVALKFERGDVRFAAALFLKPEEKQ